MSNRAIERVQNLVAQILGVNIAEWGGVPVEPAAPKADGMNNAANVPEVGARLESYNETTWDRVRSGFTTVRQSVIGFINTIPYGRYNLNPIGPLADGDKVPLQFDLNGNLKVSGTGSSTVNVDQWGGMPVSPAAAKTDAASNATMVPEVGAREQLLNAGGTWDRARGGVVGVTAAPVGYENDLPFGRFLNTPPVLAEGDFQHLMLDGNGNLRVTGSISGSDNVAQWGGVAVAPAAVKADAVTNALVVPEIGSREQLLNAGGTWDRARGGVVGVTATPTGYADELPFGRFLNTPPVLAEGDFQHLMLDSTGNLRVTGSVSSSDNIAQWGGAVVAAAAVKADGVTNALVVPEIGSREQLINGAGTWDRARGGVVGTTATPTGYQNELPMGRFVAAPPALADGTFQHLLMNSVGRLLVDTTFSASVTTVPQVTGTQNNAWNAAAVAANGVSASIDVQFTPFLTIFGSSSAATRLTVQFSQDNVTFFNGPSINVVGPDFNFGEALTVGARYVRLMSSNAVTISATIAGKD